ncbi:MAG: prolyl aminopeptidase [Pseudorhodoplanes sp.]
MTVRDRLDLYPPLMPLREYRLPVGGGHVLHVEECGNPNGQPVIILHGGPGGGSNPTMRRFHDPERYRIVLFDQRGCGRSTPNASLDNNTTHDLVADMERIRSELGIPRWQLFGGSWGSTLALAYAESYPERVSSMVLRGIFLLTKAELHWFYQDGCSWLFPEAFAEFQRLIPPAERDDMIGAYHRRLTSSDLSLRLAAARAWSIWEGTTLSLIPEADRVARFGADTYALAFARIESHFFVNSGFFSRDGELLLEAHRLRDIPAVIVHGRYDVVTPIKNAVLLSKAWPAADLRVVVDAGHAMTEPGIVHELIRATRKFASASG